MVNTFFTQIAELDIEYINYQNANKNNEVVESIIDEIDKIDRDIIFGDRLPKKINSEIVYYYLLVDKYIIIYRKSKEKKLVIRILNLRDDYKYIEHLLNEEVK
ncbi:MAG: hypothetical protein WC008_00125 [Bacilli bacterium]